MQRELNKCILVCRKLLNLYEFHVCRSWREARSVQVRWQGKRRCAAVSRSTSKSVNRCDHRLSILLFQQGAGGLTAVTERLVWCLKVGHAQHFSAVVPSARVSPGSKCRPELQAQRKFSGCCLKCAFCFDECEKGSCDT